MDQPTATPSIPQGHPEIPNGISADDVVAIITVHDPLAMAVNQDSIFPKARMNAPGTRMVTRNYSVGAHIFLQRIKGQVCFEIGRGSTTNLTQKRFNDRVDVFLPRAGIAARHFCLVPVYESDCWRLHSQSETIATVNGADIQNYTTRTMRTLNPLPAAIHLNQTVVNHITVQGLVVDIWLMKHVRDAYEPGDFKAALLHPEAQDVTRRRETWAMNRYLLTPHRVSGSSYRVIERFTGEVQTAKLFQNNANARRLRDREMLAISKQEVDASFVRYLYATEINGIPSIITPAYEGFLSYAALEDTIHEFHPGARFDMATKLMRCTFSALTFMHFHEVVHGSVSKESLLVRLVDGKAMDVLLVNYTTSRPFIPGAPVPMDDLVEDGRAAMDLVEKCCDIWALRKAPMLDAMGGEMMEGITQKALKVFEQVRRCSADYQTRLGHLLNDRKAQKLAALLDKTRNTWHSARDAQLHNASRQEVGNLSKSKIEQFVEEWDGAHAPSGIGQKQSMLLTLGFYWLDSLADQLYREQWSLTPSQVCAKLKEVGGDLEEPWQTFPIKTRSIFPRHAGGYGEQAIWNWIALCSEIYPEWRQAIEDDCALHIQASQGSIPRRNIRNLYAALSARGSLPLPMISTLELITKVEHHHEWIEETHRIWYHVPSRMFNITQIQRLASPESFVAMVNENGIRCENFIEVRGHTQIQGCYAPLSLLDAFTYRLDFWQIDMPVLTTAFPTLSPADFSQSLQGRIVLARPGLIGYGSCTRLIDQCQANFHIAKDDRKFDTLNAFLATYFGDMKVIPKMPEHQRTLERPEHWFKFKTADEIEAAADLSRRKILATKRPSQKGHQCASQAITPSLSTVMDVDESALAKILKERKRTRASARPSAKRNTNAISSKPVTPPSKRRAFQIPDGSGSALPAIVITDSFLDRAAIANRTPPRAQRQSFSPSVPRTTQPLLVQDSLMHCLDVMNASPPRVSADFGQSLTVADDDEGLNEDWEEVETMLKQMEHQLDEPLQPFMAFQYNGDDHDSDEATDVDTVSFLVRDKMLPTTQSLPPTEAHYVPSIVAGSSAFTPIGSLGSPAPSALQPRPSLVLGSQMHSNPQRTSKPFAPRIGSRLANTMINSPERDLNSSPASSFMGRQITAHKRSDGNSSDPSFIQLPLARAGLFTSSAQHLGDNLLPTRSVSSVQHASRISNGVASSYGNFINASKRQQEARDDEILPTHSNSLVLVSSSDSSGVSTSNFIGAFMPQQAAVNGDDYPDTDDSD
jgi:hypothetical protein